MPATALPLSDEEVRQFVFKGFVRLREAFSRALAAECRALLWEQLGLSPDEPERWTKPVVRLGSQDAEPFRQAAHTARLYGAFDQLVGEDRWRAHPNLGGTIPVRFPVEGDPGDAVGTSITASRGATRGGSTSAPTDARCSCCSCSDVAVGDAPTRIRVGSHLDVPAALAPYGDTGLAGFAVAERLPNVRARELALATGEAGDVYFCHPFLVHAAARHRGTAPRFLGQPGLMWQKRLDLDQAADWTSPVELAIRIGLGKL